MLAEPQVGSKHLGQSTSKLRVEQPLIYLKLNGMNMDIYYSVWL